MKCINVIIPAYNEEKSIAKVIAEIPDIVSEVVTTLQPAIRSKCPKRPEQPCFFNPKKNTELLV